MLVSLVDKPLPGSYTELMKTPDSHTKTKWLAVVTISIVIGIAIGWVSHVDQKIPTPQKETWSYHIESEEGGSALAVIKDEMGRQQCTGWEAPYDALYTDLDPHRIADILIEKKCELTQEIRLSNEATISYVFTRVDDGYIVTTPNEAQSLGQIIFVTSDEDFLHGGQAFGSTKYIAKKLFKVSNEELFLDASKDWWNFLTKSCAYSKDDLRPFSDTCSYSIYDRHGKKVVNDFYTEKELTSLTTSWYDPIHSGFLLVFVAEAPQERRQFSYIFLPLINNPRHQTIELATLEDQDAPPGKGCGIDFSSTQDSIIISGGCINPIGQPYPLVLPYKEITY